MGNYFSCLGIKKKWKKKHKLHKTHNIHKTQASSKPISIPRGVGGGGWGGRGGRGSGDFFFNFFFDPQARKIVSHVDFYIQIWYSILPDGTKAKNRQKITKNAKEKQKSSPDFIQPYPGRFLDGEFIFLVPGP